ncbi:VOC family protein [Phenylobacterium sp.]|uniref:VOC family protein n=1 Tax=Phenylobacterium sp. TaxID=1871053 RepID=UPI00286C10A6|nr:VOC family protein [Phenylobacterium sp.]
MPATLRHFAINADDVPRARRFYESVFGWAFAPWGPPGFYQTRDAGSGLYGALQGRRELVPGQRTNALETTFGVDDIAATVTAVQAAGGKIIMPRVKIEGVGELIYFEDPEGNVVGAMQYERPPEP